MIWGFFVTINLCTMSLMTSLYLALAVLHKLSECSLGGKDDLLLMEFTRTQNTLCPTRDLNCDSAQDFLCRNRSQRCEVEKISSCCGFCDCGLNCYKHGSCCLKTHTSLHHARHSVALSRYRCVAPQYFTTEDKTDYLANPDHLPAWMIAKCDSAATDRYTQDLCEKPGINGLLETLTPVAFANEHYQNKFCAFCNGVPITAELQTWKIEIVCKDMLFQAIFDQNILAKLEEKRCNMFYKRPHGIPSPEQCIYQTYTISTCNVTGFWPVYNSTIEIGCSSFTDAFNHTYKNYYCYLCNTADPLPETEWKCADSPLDNMVFPVVPFTAILDLSAVNRMKETTDELDCDDEREYEDIKLMRCLRVICEAHRYLQNEECLPMIHADNNEDLCYVVFVKLTPEVGVLFTDQQIKESIDHQVAIQLAFKTVLGGKTDSLDNCTLFSAYVRATSLAGQRIIKYVLVRLVLHSDVAFHEKNMFSDLVKKVHQTSFSVELTNGRMTFMSEFVGYNKSILTDTLELPEEVPNKDETDYDMIEMVRMNGQILFPFPRSFKCRQKTHVSFDMLHVCPFVEVSRRDLSMEVTAVNENLIINESFIYKVVPNFEFRYNSKSVFLCLNEYKRINDAMPQIVSSNRSLTSLVGPKELLSLVCVCLSITCLLITIIIYICFPELHSQPGINTIILCVFLLLAQALFQFGVGQTELQSWACSVVGAVSHFLWLSVMFAMNVCSFDMFRIFRKLKTIPSKFKWKDTFMRLLYITVFSVIFVLINFVVTESQSSGEQTGYGGMICFLSSVRMHLITFIVPSATTILANLLFFLYVTIKIDKIRANSVQLNCERNYFGIYARLSTLTGITWLFGFLQIFMQTELLEYQFILLNAGQGVFIMIAFVVNRRVFMLFKRVITKKQKPSSMS